MIDLNAEVKPSRLLSTCVVLIELRVSHGFIFPIIALTFSYKLMIKFTASSTLSYSIIFVFKMLNLKMIAKKSNKILPILRNHIKFVQTLKSVYQFEFAQFRETDSLRRAES